MQHIEVERRFPASPQQVWDVYTDHAGWKNWAGPVFKVAFLETEGRTDPNGSGAVRCFGAGPTRVLEEVLDFEPPKRMTYRVVRGGLPMKDHLGEVVFEPDSDERGEGTRVVWRCRFRAPIPLLGPLMRFGVRRLFASALEGLARHSFPG